MNLKNWRMNIMSVKIYAKLLAGINLSLCACPNFLFLIGCKKSLADYAILPFIRQFAKVERQWYLQSEYAHIRAWLDEFLLAPMFTIVMAKYDLWMDCGEEFVFG